MAKRKKPGAWAPSGFEEWGGYMAAKKLKLQEQFQEIKDKEFKDSSSLFQGICIFVNGYTKPSSDELRLIMMAHNGVYHHYLRPRVTTHIIASNLPYSKIMMHKKSQNPMPICKPEWITDSINAGRLLDYQEYLLYSNHTKTQPKLVFGTAKAACSSSAEPSSNQNEKNKIETSRTVLPVAESSKKSNVNVNNGKTSPSKDPPVKAVNSTKNPEFLSEFYNNSRLHHISTMGAVFKDYINELREKSDKTFPGLKRLKKSKILDHPRTRSRDGSDSEEEILDSLPSVSSAPKKQAVIMHIDMDCFFVSVGLRTRPELRGLPVAVTHAKGNKNPQNSSSRETEIRLYKEKLRKRIQKSNKGSENIEISTRVDKLDDHSSMSEIASCSYEARKAGVKNGMFLGQALKLCPNLKTITYDFEGYKEVSYSLYDTVAAYTLDIEAVSCDEMYADCTTIIAETGLTPMEFAQVIRREIRKKTGCPVSTGFGANKLQARLATKKAKPDGQYHLTGENIQRYMSTISTRDLPGIGSTMTYKLGKMGVYTCAELQSVSQSELQREFGKKTGEMLYNICRGIDNSKLSLEHVRKSVSAEVNYGIRFESMNDASNFLKQLSEEVSNRLNKAHVKGRCVTLKLMVRSKNAPKETAKYMGHGVCDHFTRSSNLISAVNDSVIVNKEVLNLWHQLNQVPADIRGVGIQISRLESTKKNAGNSTLMSYIGKAKPIDTDNKSKQPVIEHKSKSTSSEENKTRPPNPKGLNGYFTAKPTPTVRENTENVATVVDTRPSPSTESPNDSQPTNALETIRISSIDHEKSKSEKVDANSSKVSGGSSQGVSNEVDGFLSSEIDESVLAALPEDIRNEIISASKSKAPSAEPKSKAPSAEPKSKAPSAEPKSTAPKVTMTQKKQEFYFKESKANVERPKKSEMPPIKEIDLAVLLELPDDVRNEILNEYRDQLNESRRDTNASCSNADQNLRNETYNDNIDEANLSISQVDPDFLAALPEDVLKEVKTYCASKKIENLSKSKQSNGNIPTNAKRIEISTNKAKPGRNLGQPSKLKLNGTKLQKNNTSSKAKKNAVSVKTVQTVKQVSPPNVESNVEMNENIETNRMEIGNIDGSQRESGINWKDFNDTIKLSSTNNQKEVLKRLVEELTNLPLREVKIQMQSWISESISVNEVDFLTFTTFLSTLPKKRRIEDLHVLLKTMHRCVKSTEQCLWHQAYRKTVEHVQHHMLAVYDSSLMVPTIECDKVHCKGVRLF